MIYIAVGRFVNSFFRSTSLNFTTSSTLQSNHQRGDDRDTRKSTDSIGSWVRYGRGNRKFGLFGAVDTYSNTSRASSRDHGRRGDIFDNSSLTKRLLQPNDDDTNNNYDDDNNDDNDDDTNTNNSHMHDGFSVNGNGLGGYNDSQSGGAINELHGDVIYAGYLTKKAGRTALPGHSWQSRYFVLKKGGRLYYYNNKSSFENHPDEPIKDRPIEMFSYKVKVQYVCFAMSIRIVHN